MTHIDAAPRGSEAPLAGNGDAQPEASFWALTLGSIGVVYGDIGTSPLYALRESVQRRGRRRQSGERAGRCSASCR